MSEESGKRARVGLPVAKDEVLVEAPKAENSVTVTAAEAARAERAKSMSVSAKKSKKSDAPAKPAFVADAALITELRSLDDEALVARAIELKVLTANDASDRRVFQWTGSTQDTKAGQAITRSKIRSAVVDFLAARNEETDRLVTIGEKVYQHAAEGRVIHAYMYLGGRAIHGGSYDTGYVGARRGDNKTRGMIARGFLRIVGDLSPATEAAE